MKINIKNHVPAIFTILVWGITFISTKYLVATFTSLEILFIRFVMAYITCWIICPRHPKFVDFKFEIMIFVASLSGSSLYQYLENLSISYTNPASVSFITAVAPIFTAVLAQKYLKEKVSKSTYIGMFISIIGVFLISFGDAQKIETGLLGDLIIFGTIWLWAVYSIIVKMLSKYDLEPFLITRRLFFYSIIVLLPFITFKDSAMNYHALLKPSILINLVFLGVFASALCFSFWNISVEKLGATTTSKYLFVMPIITLIAQALYDGSSIGVTAVFGMVITLVGIAVSEYKNLFIKER